jgi:hypothetical protein
MMIMALMQWLGALQGGWGPCNAGPRGRRLWGRVCTCAPQHAMLEHPALRCGFSTGNALNHDCIAASICKPAALTYHFSTHAAAYT